MARDGPDIRNFQVDDRTALSPARLSLRNVLKHNDLCVKELAQCATYGPSLQSPRSGRYIGDGKVCYLIKSSIALFSFLQPSPAILQANHPIRRSDPHHLYHSGPFHHYPTCPHLHP